MPSISAAPSRLGTIVIAGIVGAACALLAGRYTREEPPTRTPVAMSTPVPPPAAPLRPPPGWNPRYLEPVTNKTNAEPVADPDGSAAPSEREQRRAEQYEGEVEAHRARLADHDHEAIDGGWSRASSDELTQHATELGVDARRVDCRSKTCVVDLVFPTPSDALAFMGSPKLHTLSGTLGGMIITPLPPDSDGPYTLSVVVTR